MKFRIDNNMKHFLVRVVILIALIFLSRVLFQFPVEYFKLALLKQNELTRLFSKIDALQVTAFLGVFFGFYFRERIKKLAHPKLNIKKSILFLIAAELTIALYYFIRAYANYFSITSGFILILIQLLLLASLAGAFLLFAISVFTIPYLKLFLKEFWKELIIFGIIGVIFYNVLMWFQKQWYFFSYGVSKALIGLLSLFYQPVYDFSGSAPVVGVEQFTIHIGSPCSGIDSAFLFLAFCAAIFALDHKRLNKGWFALASVLGLIGVYAVNILRLFLLILAGVYISPEFSVGLFHTNAGWGLFIIYFLCFYLVIRKFIYVKSKENIKRPTKRTD